VNRWNCAVVAGLVVGCMAAGSDGRAATPAPPPAENLPAENLPAENLPAENLVVHGQRRFIPAPVPNQRIHDPADVLRDPSTGTPMGKFGGSYIDANPVPPINPGLQGDQSPVQVGVQR
jgi:hypothetical protein